MLDGGGTTAPPTSTTTTTAAPAEEPPPPPVWSPRALWDPAGEPEPCRAAAKAWRRQGEACTTLANTLGEVGDPLPGFWQGEAADGQQRTSVNLIDEIHEAAKQCFEVADGLDDLANQIEEYNDSIHELWIAVASIVAVSVIGAFFTFGASAAAGAATTAGLVARATALARALRATLALKNVMFLSRVPKFVGLGAKWGKVIEGISFTPRLVAPGYRLARFGGFYRGMGEVFVGGLPFTFANKALSGNNPFDLGNWRVEDVTASLVGAAFFGGVGSRLVPFRGPIARPAPGTGALGRLGYTGRLGLSGASGWGRGLMFGSMAEPTGRFLIYDNPFTPKELNQAALNAGGSTGAGFGLQAIWTAVKGPATGLGGIARGGVIFVPATGIALIGTLTQGTQIVPQTGTPLFPGYVQGPDVPGGFPQQVPGVPAPMSPPVPRMLAPGEVLNKPTDEPLRVVVRPGETLWGFAERVYGDGRQYKRIWKANNFLLDDPNNPDLIHPGQELLIPPIPTPH
jgi:LysM domain